MLTWTQTIQTNIPSWATPVLRRYHGKFKKEAFERKQKTRKKRKKTEREEREKNLGEVGWSQDCGLGNLGSAPSPLWSSSPHFLVL